MYEVGDGVEGLLVCFAMLDTPNENDFMTPNADAVFLASRGLGDRFEDREVDFDSGDAGLWGS